MKKPSKPRTQKASINALKSNKANGKKAKGSLVTVTTYPRRAADVFVNQKMLFGVRDQLKSHTKSCFKELNSKLVSLDSKVQTLDVKIQDLDSRIQNLDSKLDSKTQALDSKIDAKFHELDSKFDSRIQALDSKFDSKFQDLDSKLDTNVQALNLKIDTYRLELNAKIDATESRLNSSILNLTSEVHRLGVLVEEQNNRNKIVLDGLAHIFDRQERLESTINK